MLLIDGVKYELWTPPNEDEFEQLIKEHTKDIFGEESIYFDRKQKLKSLSGIGSIPDGYAISLQGTPCWYICEVELHTHPLYEHIVPQMTKFINGVKSLSSQRELINAFYGGLNSNLPNEALVRSKIGPTEVYHFISDLVSKPPILVIVINQKTRELEEVCDSLPIEVKIVEFQTFTREGVGLAVHAHLFEPIFQRRTDSPGNHRVIISEFTGKVTAQSAVADTLKDSMKTVKEIAEITGLKENNIRTSLSRLKGMGKATKIGDKWGLRTYPQDDMPFA